MLNVTADEASAGMTAGSTYWVSATPSCDPNPRVAHVACIREGWAHVLWARHANWWPWTYDVPCPSAPPPPTPQGPEHQPLSRPTVGTRAGNPRRRPDADLGVRRQLRAGHARERHQRLPEGFGVSEAPHRVQHRARPSNPDGVRGRADSAGPRRFVRAGLPGRGAAGPGVLHDVYIGFDIGSVPFLTMYSSSPTMYLSPLPPPYTRRVT